MLSFLSVAIGSALGGMLRFAVGLLAARAEQMLPLSAVWSTMLINIGGSFLIGYISTATAAGSRFPLSQEARLFLMVGFCGGFTTFSSFSLQTFDLLRSGSPWKAASNVLLSVALCLAAVVLGHQAGSGTRPPDSAQTQAPIEERVA
jgi:fluoride exporter